MILQSENVFENCSSMDDLQVSALAILEEHAASGREIHYVAGPISSDGDEHIQRNIAELQRQRAGVAAELGERAVVFCALDIFTPTVFDRLKVFGMPRDEREEKMRQFWHSIFESGGIKKAHFADRWWLSVGASLEHDDSIAFNIERAYLPAVSRES